MKNKKQQLDDIISLLIEHLESTTDTKEVADVAQVMINGCNNPKCAFCNDLKAFIALPDSE